MNLIFRKFDNFHCKAFRTPFKFENFKLIILDFFRSYQVRGHLAAQIDPLGLNNMEKDKARNMIIRSVKVDEKDFETEFQLPTTTWIGGEQKSLPLKEIINR